MKIGLPFLLLASATKTLADQPLIYIADDGFNEEKYPLGECEGDCDGNDDCLPGLVCKHRTETESLAAYGCTGEGTSAKDYCVNVYSSNVVQDVGNNFSPAIAFPLGLCEGDCDNHKECASGLRCQQRSSDEAVQGCVGDLTPHTGNDICVFNFNRQLTNKGNNWSPAQNFPLSVCEGDCDSDSDCLGDLICLQRDGSVPTVDGCTGQDTSSRDYCVEPPTAALTFVAPDYDPNLFPLGECEGDCDNDDDCAGELQCRQRAADERIPGCEGTAFSGTDYCYNPFKNTEMKLIDENHDDDLFPLVLCESDCDSDSDCANGLVCFQRSSSDASLVPGCSMNTEGSFGLVSEDFCVLNRSKKLSEKGNNGSPLHAFPLLECEGDCDNDSECAGDLVCFQRSTDEAVPGCSSEGASSGTDYCIDPNAELDVETLPPGPELCPNGPVNYVPGLLAKDIVDPNGLANGPIRVSQGLEGRVITKYNVKVQFKDGSESTEVMHEDADGAATLPDDTDPTKYYLVSNSEDYPGGVGILHMDASTMPHEVIGYRRTGVLTSTGSNNCGGGRSPWGTWFSSQESGSGSVVEVDPNDTSGQDFERTAIVPDAGGNYEANAYWLEPATDTYHFFTTEDATPGKLTRFIPSINRTTMEAIPRKLDRLKHGLASGTHEYLRLECTSDCGGDNPSGTYTWMTTRADVGFPYPKTEGLDVKGTQLFMTAKTQLRLYIVELDSNTWTSAPTVEEDSDGSYDTFSPDQIARITGSNHTEDFLYFAQDGGGQSDIHARGFDPVTGEYRFVTLIEGSTVTETTGLTFSPDNSIMYFAHQGNSEIWQIWRTDGCTFGSGLHLDIKYHDFITRMRGRHHRRRRRN